MIYTPSGKLPPRSRARQRPRGRHGRRGAAGGERDGGGGPGTGRGKRDGERRAASLGGAGVSGVGGDNRADPRAARSAESIWVNQVPEPRTVKNRVHLDVCLAAPDPTPLIEAGARLVREPDAEIGWWVLADPEGNLFCAFAPRENERSGTFELVVDSADPAGQARWWAGVVGGTVEVSEKGYASVADAAGFPGSTGSSGAGGVSRRTKSRSSCLPTDPR